MVKRLFMILLVLTLGGSASMAQTSEDTGSGPGFVFNPGSNSYLGVYLREVTQERAKELGLKAERGAIVMKVTPGSPAEKAGLKADDVIVSFNGQPVESVRQLHRLMTETPAGRNVRIEVFRGGSTTSLTATMGERSYHFPGMNVQQMERLNRRMAEAGKKMGELKPEELEKLNQNLAEAQKKFGNLHFDFSGISPNFNFTDIAPWGMSRGRLGVTVDPLTDQLAKYFGVKEGLGLLVSEVKDNTPAARAGLKAGDVIIRIDDQRVNNLHDVMAALGKKEEGPVAVTVLRNRSEQKFNVTLEKRAPHPGGSAFLQSPDMHPMPPMPPMPPLPPMPPVTVEPMAVPEPMVHPAPHTMVFPPPEARITI